MRVITRYDAECQRIDAVNSRWGHNTNCSDKRPARIVFTDGTFILVPPQTDVRLTVKGASAIEMRRVVSDC